MTKLEKEALASGYNRSPNNETLWYPGGPNIPELPLIMEVHIEQSFGGNEQVVVYGREYGPLSRLFQMMKFNTFAEYMEYATENGRRSLPGLAPFSNSWD